MARELIVQDPQGDQRMPMNDAKALLTLRWALIFALAYLSLSGEGAALDPRPLAYVAILFGTQILLREVVLKRANDRTAIGFVLGTDSLLALSGLTFFTSASRDLSVAYFLCIVIAAVADTERRLAAMAIFAVGLYSLWMLHAGHSFVDARTLLPIPFLFVTTLFYGYLMLRIRRETTRREGAEREARGLDSLLTITREFASSLVTEEVFNRTAMRIQEAIRADTCRIFPIRSDQRLEEEEHVLQVVRTRDAVSDVVEGGGETRRSVLAIPIVFEGEVLAVMLAESIGRETPFTREEREFCEVIAHAAAPAIKNAERYQRLASLERARTEFLTSLSHEIRTPLHAILGYADLAREEAESLSAEDLMLYLDRLSKNAEEMSEHVGNLLQLSQLTMGRSAEVAREPVDIADILQAAVEKAKANVSGQAIDFSTNVDASIGAVWADREKLSRILDCLLANAVKFTPAGSIQVCASVVSGDTVPDHQFTGTRVLSLSVRDTGIGIPNERIGELFEEFKRGDASTTSRYGGLGIGLAISRRLAEALGGTIRVESRPGAGSLFQVFVPCGS